MKWFRNHRGPAWLPIAAVLISAIAARADLSRWAQDIASGTPLEAAFFKNVTLGGVVVKARRAPAETRPELTRLITANPADARLYWLRALEAEQQLDIGAAEADWTQYAERSKDKFAGRIALADFYHRRVEAAKELPALHAAAILPGFASERFETPAEQSAWKTFERAVSVIDDHLLGFDAASAEFRAWIERYPKEPGVYTRYFDYSIAHKQYAIAAQAAKQYAAAFPSDAVFPVSAEAQLEAARGSSQAALAVYDRSFQPLWPAELVKSYFELLARTGSLRRYLGEARAKPGDINAAARIFYYWQQQGNLANAQHALMEFESRKPAKTAAELWILGQLYEAANNPDRAARSYYALYTLAGVASEDAERALAALIHALFTYAGQGIRFGSNDLAYYRDVAQADPYPGFLNGILSLILNTTQPSYKYSAENQQAQPYFHRARAAELVTVFDTRFPNSQQRAPLDAQRIDAYAVHGDDAAVIRAGLDFRKQFPNAPQRIDVATLMADAYARTNQTTAEFALYDELLQELSTQSEGMPLGRHAGLPAPARSPDQPPAEQDTSPQTAPKLQPRSPAYARVLDRYIARLVGLKRIPAALALYRRELDRNPNDPGLYERFAAFLEQNRLGGEVEATYKRAMAQFPDRSWSHKLARWYLRQKQTTQLAGLTREVVDAFSGSELEAYFASAVPRGSLAAALYLQLNSYAHQRFPHNLTFTRNLLTAYQTRGTENPAAYEALLRESWFNAPDLGMRFFEYLSRTRKLDAELTAVGGITTPQQVNANPIAARMFADGQAWKTHFESAAPVYRAMAVAFPVSSPTAERAAALYRSLGTIDPGQTGIAAGIQENLVKYEPASAAALTYEGEIYADRERFDRARPVWNRIASIAPGRENGYLESATVFWDYFLYDDALRVIEEGRRKLNSPSLFAYQAGAIYENKRQYDRALTEYASAALDQSSDIAQRRLVRLARRSELRDRIERLTADAANRTDAAPRAILLRSAILENQGRRTDLEAFLIAAANRTNSFETIDAIENQGRMSGFAAVQEASIERRVAITSDPIDQMRYQLALAHFLEDQGRPRDAQRVLSVLYQAHPASLGVVRAATDYYWRNKQPKRAVGTLIEAAGRAQPVYQNAFRLEAARKATESGDSAAARQLLTLLLKVDPYRAEYLAAMADTYAQAGDDAGLRAFYRSTIDAIHASNLTLAEKTERTAALRRGLIPVLTRTRDYAGALDQYMAILDGYPEDEQLTRDAASYAAVHQLGDRLIAYYLKAVSEAPRDYRWPVVLARVDTALERFPEAIEAYSKATAIRPDRTDLWIAQAGLQERLLRFADAERNYARLFELTYHNPAWMERVATVRARRGQRDGAIAALRAAYIENRPARAEAYFTIASRLLIWGYIDPARQYAERGAELAGPQLTGAEGGEGAAVYARVLGQARQFEIAYTRLTANGTDPENAPLLSPALRALGATVSEFYTPEEKVRFAAFLERQRTSSPALLSEAIQSAGLEDVTVQRLFAMLRAKPVEPGLQNQLAEHQRRRLRFSELGGQLEAVWKSTPADTEGRDALLARAAEAYQQAGDAVAELRVLRLSFVVTPRLCHLLMEQRPVLLTLAAAGTPDNMRDFAANCAVENGRAADALRAIVERGKGLPPVWTSAYTGITGLYFALTTPRVREAFLQALGSPVIGERIGKPADRDRQIAGEPWFYYGARYGEFLRLARDREAPDYLPAMVESMPGNAGAYFELAESYREAGDSERSLTEFGHVLELDPQRGAAHDRRAQLMWAAGRREDAIAEWRLALEAFNAAQDRGAAPPGFWDEIKTTLTHVGQADVLAAVRPQADVLLKTYLRRNGTYQFEPLLEGILAAAGSPAEGAGWLGELGRSAADPMAVLAIAVRSSAVPDAQRDGLFQKLIDNEQAKLTTSFGQPRESAETSLRTWQMEWLRSLVDRAQTDRARTLLSTIPDSARKPRLDQIIPLEMRIAAQSGTIQPLLARYAAAREPVPAEALRNGANELRRTGFDLAARRVLEFVYTRELEARHFDVADFLGLAEIRLEEKQAPAAIELLRRMTLVAGEPFDTLMSAGALLERFGLNAEATAFYRQRIQAAPWDAAARAHLDPKSVSGDRQAAYATRADAAIALRLAGGATITTGSAELNLLASSTPLTEAAVNQPYWYFSRAQAASAIQDPAAEIRLLRAAIAIDPQPPQPRLLLFQTALSRKQYQLAASSMPLQSTSEETPAAAFLPETVFNAAERASIALGLGEVFERLDDPERAIYYLRMALELEPARRAAIRTELNRLETAVKLKQENEQRRPVIGKNLEQAHVVRPKLARAAQGAGQ